MTAIVFLEAPPDLNQEVQIVQRRRYARLDDLSADRTTACG